jgi:chromosome partitioning protein
MVRLVISNQRGGVSKTTTTVTLARIYADQGLRVLAIDTDPQGSLGLVLGLKPQKYLHDFVVHNCAFGECIVPAAPRVDVLCSSRDTTKIEAVLRGMTGRELAFSTLLGLAETSYDLVLIDVAPSINLIQACSLCYAQRLLIPVAMDMLSLQGAVASLETGYQLSTMFRKDIRPLALLPVKVDRRFSLTVYVLQALEEISQQYHVPLLHPIRTDGTVPRAERAREFLVDYDAKCKALEDYTTAASQLMELLNVIPEAEYHEEVLSA